MFARVVVSACDNRCKRRVWSPLLGGVNSIWGPPMGAVLFLGLEQVLAAWFPSAHLGIYGLLLILMMMFEPRGLWSVISGRLRRRALIARA